MPDSGNARIGVATRRPEVVAVEADEIIQAKFDAMGGERFFGSLTSKDPGRIWTFANGACICYNPEKRAAFEVHGAIYAKWLSMGGPSFAVPETDETTAPDGVGRFNHFRGGVSVYWTAETDANAIYGAIRERWSAMGWEMSYLGYPVTDEVDFAEGGRANEFQNGGIYWWPDAGAIDLRDVVVHYTGLHCFGETDWDRASSADEPYAIISISTPRTANTMTTRIYPDVDDGESRPDVMEIYRGRPYGMNINAIMMENDVGDPDRYREEVKLAVDSAHATGTAALGLVSLVGPVVAALAGPSLATLMPTISGALNDAFDWGDDRIGGANMTLSAKQMVLLAARTHNSEFDGIGFKVESPLISGLGASYKVYFGLVPT
jgi:hypothetical protein